MKVETTRFGDIEIQEERAISFPEGLPGFSEAHRFVLLDHHEPSPFQWLQSLDEPGLAFVVIVAGRIDPAFSRNIPLHVLAELDLTDPADAAVLVVVTIDRRSRRVTANLLGPLVIDPVTRRGKQAILMNSGLSTKHELAPPVSHEPACA
jgi:flagellar assembly factor FliW